MNVKMKERIEDRLEELGKESLSTSATIATVLAEEFGRQEERNALTQAVCSCYSSHQCDVCKRLEELSD